MTTKLLIDRELLERIDESAICDGTDATISDDLFTQLVGALDATRQPEGGGLTRYGIGIVGGITAFVSADDGCMVLHDDHQRAIAELREECEQLRVFNKSLDEEATKRLQDVIEAENEAHTLRQQLAEARDEITQHSNDLSIAYMAGGADMRHQRDKLAGLLERARGCIDAMGWDDLETAIDAALAEVKPCPESPAPTT